MHALTHTSRARTGFSLIELLLAIFILGIGILGIAALFPAGIVQQRQATDDTLGSLVANNALAMLRTRLSQEDFGSFEEHLPANFNITNEFGVRVPGDWPWLRPGMVFGADPDTENAEGDQLDDRGMLDIFSWYPNFDGAVNSMSEFPGGIDGNSILGLPFSTTKYPSGAPRIRVTAGERAYPGYSQMLPTKSPTSPQYHWDCMFRKYLGRVWVAIFVYRVTPPPGTRERYIIADNPMPNQNFPALPYRLDLADNVDVCAEGAWSAGDSLVLGTSGGNDYDPFDRRMTWQEPGQWLLDQNNNLYRVLGNSRISPDDDVEVELRRPIPEVPNIIGSYFPDTAEDLDPANGMGDTDLIGTIWYIPTVDPEGRTLTPVYVLVEEL